MFLFFSEQIINDQLILTDDEHKHCAKVLRKNEGDTIYVTDGKGNIHTAVINHIKKNETYCKIAQTDSKVPLPRSITIAISPTKNASRIEWFVEKAVEIGITCIVLFQAHRTEKKSFNTKRLEKIMISAMKQSLNVHLPQLHYFENADNMIKSFENIDQKYIAYCDGPIQNLNVISNSDSDVVVLIGPEGDFTPKEIEKAQNAGFIPVSLGESRLRTETAGVVALMMLRLQ